MSDSNQLTMEEQENVILSVIDTIRKFPFVTGTRRHEGNVVEVLIHAEYNGPVKPYGDMHLGQIASTIANEVNDVRTLDRIISRVLPGAAARNVISRQMAQMPVVEGETEVTTTGRVYLQLHPEHVQ